MAKPKYPLTPVGRLVYPYLLEPDTEFEASGVYHTKFALPIDEAEPLVEAIVAAQAYMAEETAKRNKGKQPKAGPLPYYVDQDAMEVVFKFKQKAVISTGHEIKPVIKAPDGSLLTIKPGNGSKGFIAYEIVPFWNASQGCGVTLRLRGVKVTELVEIGASTDMFGDETTPTNNNTTNLGDF